jgi:hypothetical protein
MAYCSASDVGILCQNLLGKAEDFDMSTSPTITAVNMWLSTGCAIINSQIKSAGYSAPIASTSDAYDVAKQANAAYGAWWAERSRLNARVSSDERTRADMFKKDFDALMKVLLSLDLSEMGVTNISRMYAGGISVSDKETIEGDTDRVTPRFARGMFSNPAALEPGPGGSSGDPQTRDD